MSAVHRAAALATALLALSAAPATARADAPPTLAGTDLSSFSGAATVTAAECSERAGFAAFEASGVAANSTYEGPFTETGVARLKDGGLSEDLEPRTLLAATHRFTIESPYGPVFGTHRASLAADAASCASPLGEAALYLSYFPDTRYAARIETEEGVYVDRGEGYVQVDMVEFASGDRLANTQTFFDSSNAEGTRLLRPADCRNGGFAPLAYESRGECRLAAESTDDD